MVSLYPIPVSYLPTPPLGKARAREREREGNSCEKKSLSLSLSLSAREEERRGASVRSRDGMRNKATQKAGAPDVAALGDRERRDGSLVVFTPSRKAHASRYPH